MKPLFLQLTVNGQEAFKVLLDESPYFYSPLHFHRELQLTLIRESTGTRIVGDRIERFEEGEIILLGSNLPHVFRNDPAYYEKNSGMQARAISIFFLPDFLGKKFMQLEETAPIRQVIREAARGIRIFGKTNKKIAKLMVSLLNLKGFPRLMTLCEILHLISTSSEIEFLASSVLEASPKKADSSKINEVFEYVMKRFAEEIKLESVASVANMSPTAFCRYFKRQTRKTFSQFLNEIRVGHACQLLMEEQYSITQIGYQCGFNNISNFNRQFKAITSYTPSQYQQKHRQRVPAS